MKFVCVSFPPHPKIKKKIDKHNWTFLSLIFNRARLFIFIKNSKILLTVNFEILGGDEV